jgi:hypothetical protein
MKHFDVIQARTAGTTSNKDDDKKFANLIGPTDPKVLDRKVREIADHCSCGTVAQGQRSLAIWPLVSSWSMPTSGAPLLPQMGVIFITIRRFIEDVAST